MSGKKFPQDLRPYKVRGEARFGSRIEMIAEAVRALNPDQAKKIVGEEFKKLYPRLVVFIGNCEVAEIGWPEFYRLRKGSLLDPIRVSRRRRRLQAAAAVRKAAKKSRRASKKEPAVVQTELALGPKDKYF